MTNVLGQITKLFSIMLGPVFSVLFFRRMRCCVSGCIEGAYLRGDKLQRRFAITKLCDFALPIPSSSPCRSFPYIYSLLRNRTLPERCDFLFNRARCLNTITRIRCIHLSGYNIDMQTALRGVPVRLLRKRGHMSVRENIMSTLAAGIWFLLAIHVSACNWQGSGSEFEAPAQSIYIDASAQDGGDGSREDPYNDFGDINWETGGDNSVEDWILEGYQVMINLKRGGTWRETLTVGASGREGRPITIQAYGEGEAPVVSGGDPVVGWTERWPDIWESVASQEPKVVLLDGTYGIEKPAIVDLRGENEWCWESGTLYVYSTKSPDIAYVNPGVEAAARNFGLNVNGNSYLVFRDLNFHMARYAAVYISGEVREITFQSCSMNYGYEFGLVPEMYPIQRSVTIENCTAAYNGAVGLYVGQNDTGWVIEGNTLVRNGYIERGGHVELEYGAGIKLITDGGGNTVQNNSVSYTGIKDDGSIVGVAKGHGIWLDLSTGGSNRVRYNRTFLNGDSGIFVEKSKGHEVYYNLSWDNGQDGIRMDSDEDGNSEDNRFFNNVLYGNGRNGISSHGGWRASGQHSSNNVFINNVSVGNEEHEFSAKFGGENNGTNGFGNVYEFNCFGNESPGFIEWGGVTKDSYTSWEDAYGGSTSSVEADPEFMDPERGDFRLKPTSPCINAGTDVSLILDYARSFVPKGRAVDIGAFEY